MALLFLSSRADAAGKRIGVPAFEGAQEAAIRLKVMQALQAHGFEMVRARDMQEAMVLDGIGLDSDDEVKTLAKELALSAIVTGEVGPKRAKIVVRDGGEGSILGVASFSGADPRKLADEVGLTFWKKLGPDVERGQVPAGAKKKQRTSSEASTENDESAPAHPAGTVEGGESGEAPPPKKVKKRRFKMEETAPEEVASARSLPPGNPWLDVELGVGGLNRSLSFSQNVAMPGYGVVLPYTLGLGPIGIAKLVGFPWAAGKVGNFGLEAVIQQGFGISTGSFSDTVHEYAGGFRYRVLFATSDDVFFSATFGEDAFAFSGANRSSLPTPDTIYHYVRLGTGMHVSITDGIGLSFGGGYRHVTNRGGSQISEDVFPHLTVAGADADIVARYALNDMFELRAGLEWRRYWYATHSQPGDPVIASGAVDQSFAFTAGIAIVLGLTGAPGAEQGATAAPTPAAPSARSTTKPSDDEESGSPDGDSGEPK